MPTTLTSLAIFVALLTPGFIYLHLFEARLPGRKLSSLRETALVATVSLIADWISLALFALLAWISGQRVGPDLGAFVDDPGTYFTDHMFEVAFWASALWASAMALAALAAAPPQIVARIRSDRLRKLVSRRNRNPVLIESAWTIAFNRYPERKVHLALVLDDGSYVYGELGYFSTAIEESPDRDLEIRGPIDFRPPKGKKVLSLDGGCMILSASRVKTMTVYYLPKLPGGAPTHVSSP